MWIWLIWDAVELQLKIMNELLGFMVQLCKGC